MTEQEKQTQLEKLKLRLPYSEVDFGSDKEYNAILNQLLEDSENIALSDLYPFDDWSEKQLPKKLFNWQIRACIEICNYLGKEGLVSYSENGLSISRLADGLSCDLRNEIMPNAGTIRPRNATQGGTL